MFVSVYGACMRTLKQPRDHGGVGLYCRTSTTTTTCFFRFYMENMKEYDKGGKSIIQCII